jgi:hypothetical protein
MVMIANTLFGLPPVVVGLAVYLLLSRSGPLSLSPDPSHLTAGALQGWLR